MCTALKQPLHFRSYFTSLSQCPNSYRFQEQGKFRTWKIQRRDWKCSFERSLISKTVTWAYDFTIKIDTALQKHKPDHFVSYVKRAQ